LQINWYGLLAEEVSDNLLNLLSEKPGVLKKWWGRDAPTKAT
jgi:hypothetical protein